MKAIKSIGAVIRGKKAEPPRELPDHEIPSHLCVKMGSQEMDHINQARKGLSDVTVLAQYAILYKDVGWSPVALDAHTGTSLPVDFDQPHSTWLNLLMDLALKNTRVSLAIRLKPDSQLFVLSVNPAFGKEFLDSLGEWRSPCMARIGDSWENHFLVLPRTWCFSPGHDRDDEDAPLSVAGPGRVVAVPPSGDPASQETWDWLSHPWEQPPGHPTPGLLLLLEEGGYISRKRALSEEDLPTWDDIFPSISHSSKLLQALLASMANKESYYRTILSEALQAGFKDPVMLQGLLWHAPHGEMRQDPEGLHKLSHWAAEIEKLLSSGALEAESRSPGALACQPRPPQPGPGDRPVAPSSPAGLGNELDFLATLAARLEQQVDELERQQVFSTAEPGDWVFQSRAPLENERDFEELRCALEKFLAKNPNLLDSK